MNAGTLIVLLLIVGGLFAMFSMHRGGRAHGGIGGCGGHGDKHGDPSTDERQEEDKKPPLDKPGPHDHEPAVADAGRSGS